MEDWIAELVSQPVRALLTLRLILTLLGQEGKATLDDLRWLHAVDLALDIQQRSDLLTAA